MPSISLLIFSRLIKLSNLSALVLHDNNFTTLLIISNAITINVRLHFNYFVSTSRPIITACWLQPVLLYQYYCTTL